MQKMITITINTRMLSAGAQEAFTVTEVEQVNDMLEAGWLLEEWDFLNETPDEHGNVSLVAVLNDAALGMDDDDLFGEHEDEFDEEFEEEEEEDKKAD